MTRTTMLLAAMLAGALGPATGCDDKPATPVAAPKSAAPTATPAPPSTAAPTATATDAPAPEPSFSGPVKAYACGAKDQKPCPMQGWMKSVMAGAASSGEPEKLAQALAYVAARVPPGYDKWAAMANAGVAKAKAGDIDGAKVTCKQCHDAYKESYKATMRDRPW